MRIIEIAMFMLIFTSTLGAVDGLGLYGGVSTNSTSININANDIQNLTPNTSTLTDIQIWTLWSVLVEAWNVLSKMLGAAFLTGYYLQQLVPIIPTSLATIVTVVVNALYILGFVQFITNRPTKTMR